MFHLLVERLCIARGVVVTPAWDGQGNNIPVVSSGWVDGSVSSGIRYFYFEHVPKRKFPVGRVRK